MVRPLVLPLHGEDHFLASQIYTDAVSETSSELF